MVGFLFPETTLTPHDRRGSLEEISRGGGWLVAHCGSGLVLPTKSTALPLRKELTYLQHAHDGIGLGLPNFKSAGAIREWSGLIVEIPTTGRGA